MITLAGIEPNTRLVNSFIANCNSPERALIAFNKYGPLRLRLVVPSPSPRAALLPKSTVADGERRQDGRG
jgi:hypothetical protein